MNNYVKQCSALLFRYLKPYRTKVAILFFLLGCNIILQLASPQIIRAFIDTAVSKKPSHVLFMFAGLFISIAILQQIASLLANYFSQDIGWAATNALRKDLVSHCLHLDMTFHKSFRSGEIIERLDGDINQTFNFFSNLSLNII